MDAEQVFIRTALTGMPSLSEKAAADNAGRMQLPDGLDMAGILDIYPTPVTRAIAREYNLDPYGLKRDMIQDVTHAMPKIVPKILDKAPDGAIEAIKYIAEHDNMMINKLRNTLRDAVNRAKRSDSYLFRSFDELVRTYMKKGILTPGVKKVNGANRRIVTMPSDVKRVVSTHMGWSVASDGAALRPSRLRPKISVTPRETKLLRGSDWKVVLEPRRKPLFGAPRPSSIYKRGRIEVRVGDGFENPIEAVMAYALARYGDEFEAERKRCPYNMNLGSGNMLKFTQQMTWFIMERKNPATGVTILEEFVRETTSGHREVADVLMQCTELFFDVFRVKEHRGDDIIVHGIGSDRTYRVTTAAGPRNYPIGLVFEGRIHPYYEKYKLCGIVTKFMKREGMGLWDRFRSRA